jgi:hypothetical protein
VAAATVRHIPSPGWESPASPGLLTVNGPPTGPQPVARHKRNARMEMRISLRSGLLRVRNPRRFSRRELSGDLLAVPGIKRVEDEIKVFMLFPPGIFSIYDCIGKNR